MNFRLGVVLVVAVLSASCFGVNSSPAPRSAPLPSPRETKVDGAVTHAASKLTFPAKVGNFRLQYVTQFDKEGYDLSASYETFPPSTAVTVYIYPGPQMKNVGAARDAVASFEKNAVERELAGVTAQVAARHEGLQQTGGAVFATRLGPGQSRHWSYKERSILGTSQVATCTWIALADHRWFVKVRASAPAKLHPGADAAAESILKAIAGT